MRFAFLISITTLFFSCSSSNRLTSDQQAMNGLWIVKTITTEGTSERIGTLMNDVDFNCFVGSLWSFNSKSFTGTYEIKSVNGKNCTDLKRTFHWNMSSNSGSPAKLSFVRVNTDGTLTDLDKQYEFYLLEKSEGKRPTNLKFRNTYDIKGKPVTFIISFSRI